MQCPNRGTVHSHAFLRPHNLVDEQESDPLHSGEKKLGYAEELALFSSFIAKIYPHAAPWPERDGGKNFNQRRHEVINPGLVTKFFLVVAVNTLVEIGRRSADHIDGREGLDQVRGVAAQDFKRALTK